MYITNQTHARNNGMTMRILADNSLQLSLIGSNSAGDKSTLALMELLRVVLPQVPMAAHFTNHYSEETKGGALMIQRGPQTSESKCEASISHTK